MATLGANASLYSEQHRITYYECDRTGRATLTTLIDIAVLASEDQSDALGLTTEMVQSHGVGWVVTQYAMPDGKSANGAFPHNPNGSLADIAGICDASGRVFGLMPHPEAYNHVTNHPDWTRQMERNKRAGIGHAERTGAGIQIFENAVAFFSSAG